MTRISVACSILIVLVAVPALAQKKSAGAPIATQASISSSEVKATPEMWFYQQYQQRYDDPKTMVHERAKFRAAQREHRLAAMQWFGFSNSRPRACSDPWHSDYSPGWSSNNTVYPYQWTGVGRPWIVVRPDAPGMHTH